MIAAVTIKGLGGNGRLQYNNAIPLLMREFSPTGCSGSRSPA